MPANRTAEGLTRGDALIHGTIKDLLNFEKYTSFPDALRGAAIANDFQMILLSADMHPVFSVETRHRTTVGAAVRLGKDYTFSKAAVYTKIDVNGIAPQQRKVITIDALKQVAEKMMGHHGDQELFVIFQFKTDRSVHPVAAHSEYAPHEAERGKTCVKIGFSVIIHQYAGIENETVAFLFSPRFSVRVRYAAVIGERTCRIVRDRNAGALHGVQLIVKVITSVLSSYAVRCAHMHLTFLIAGILVFSVDHAFAAPIGKIVSRRRPANIIA